MRAHGGQVGKFLGIVLTVALACAAIVQPAGATAIPPKTVLIYGDSLVWESATVTAHSLGRGWIDLNTSYPSTAPCDWLGRLPADLAAHHPNVVTLATAGNTGFTCMAGIETGSPDYYARYRSDLTAIFSVVISSGAQMVFVADPPFLDPVRDAAVVQITAIATDLASQFHGVTIYRTARKQLSTKTGGYTAYAKCLKPETAVMGCGPDGLIAIRTISGEAAQIGLHLCPDSLTFPGGCDMYSSGELRFGKALAAATKHPHPVVP